MLIAHLSDTHITNDDELAYGVCPTNSNLEQCIDELNNLTITPDVAIITGDITYRGKIEETQTALKIINQLKFPYFIVPGNHDNKEYIQSNFKYVNCPAKDHKFINYVIDDYKIRLIGLDSSVENKPGGYLDNEQLDWLDKRLAENTKKPTIIFMHHPPVKCGVLETDQDGFIGTEKLGDILVNYNNIERIICGHIHLSSHVEWCNTIVSTAPSMGLGLALDLSLKKDSQFYNGSPGYQLHLQNCNGEVVSHAIFSQKDSIPHFFK